MRALEKEPGRALPERRRLHRRPRRGAQGPGRARRRHGRLRAAAAGRRRRRRTPTRSEPEEEERRRRRRLDRCVAVAVADRRPGRPRADPRHDHRGPERDRRTSSTSRSRCSSRTASRSARSSGSSAKRRPNTVLEQDPAASPPATASLDCAFLTFFCSKPKVTLTVSAGPGSAKVPSTAGLTSDEGDRKAGRGRLRSPRSKRVNSDTVEEGLVIHSEPAGGEHRDPRLDRDPHRLQRPEAGQGAGPGRHPALASRCSRSAAAASTPASTKKKARRRRAR